MSIRKQSPAQLWAGGCRSSKVTEAITKDLLDSISVDHAAQSDGLGAA